jgi:predicted DNA-binding protein YlxM (UPF0122 family)
MKIKWSLKHNECKSCGKTDHKHIARGLCVLCYRIFNNSINRGEIKDKKENLLTKEYLIEEYVNKNKSMVDIAKEYGCSRQNIMQQLTKYNIPTRNKSDARVLALNKSKILFKAEDREVVLQKNLYNEDFFTNWTPEMAYVLGVIITDGNILKKGDKQPGRLTISQKEPELLNKVLKLMKCSVKVLLRKEAIYNGKKAGQIYYFHIYSDKIFNQLIALGIMQNKSKISLFPVMPESMVRHFIRGCWDGDGSICKNRASFISASVDLFASIKDKLNTHFVNMGTEPLKSYQSIGNGTELFHLYTNSIKQTALLFQFMYEGVQRQQYLTRKYKKFNMIYKRYIDSTGQ